MAIGVLLLVFASAAPFLGLLAPVLLGALTLIYVGGEVLRLGGWLGAHVPWRRFITALLILACFTGHTFFLGALATVRSCGRPRYSECKSNLRAGWTAATMYYQEKDHYSDRPAVIGFAPERNNRYAYFLSFDGALQDRSQPIDSPPDANSTGIQADTHRYGPHQAVTAEHLQLRFPWLTAGLLDGDQQFIFVCAGNIDRDPDLDVWTVASFWRVADDGSPIPPGDALDEVDDTAN